MMSSGWTTTPTPRGVPGPGPGGGSNNDTGGGMDLTAILASMAEKAQQQAATNGNGGGKPSTGAGGVLTGVGGSSSSGAIQLPGAGGSGSGAPPGGKGKGANGGAGAPSTAPAAPPGAGASAPAGAPPSKEPASSNTHALHNGKRVLRFFGQGRTESMKVFLDSVYDHLQVAHRSVQLQPDSTTSTGTTGGSGSLQSDEDVKLREKLVKEILNPGFREILCEVAEEEYTKKFMTFMRKDLLPHSDTRTSEAGASAGIGSTEDGAGTQQPQPAKAAKNLWPVSEEQLKAFKMLYGLEKKDPSSAAAAADDDAQPSALTSSTADVDMLDAVLAGAANLDGSDVDALSDAFSMGYPTPLVMREALAAIKEKEALNPQDDDDMDDYDFEAAPADSDEGENNKTDGAEDINKQMDDPAMSSQDDSEGGELNAEQKAKAQQKLDEKKQKEADQALLKFESAIDNILFVNRKEFEDEFTKKLYSEKCQSAMRNSSKEAKAKFTAFCFEKSPDLPEDSEVLFRKVPGFEKFIMDQIESKGRALNEWLDRFRMLISTDPRSMQGPHALCSPQKLNEDVNSLIEDLAKPKWSAVWAKLQKTEAATAKKTYLLKQLGLVCQMVAPPAPAPKDKITAAAPSKEQQAAASAVKFNLIAAQKYGLKLATTISAKSIAAVKLIFFKVDAANEARMDNWLAMIKRQAEKDFLLKAEALLGRYGAMPVKSWVASAVGEPAGFQEGQEGAGGSSDAALPRLSHPTNIPPHAARLLLLEKLRLLVGCDQWCDLEENFALYCKLIYFFSDGEKQFLHLVSAECLLKFLRDTFRDSLLVFTTANASLHEVPVTCNKSVYKVCVLGPDDEAVYPYSEPRKMDFPTLLKEFRYWLDKFPKDEEGVDPNEKKKMKPGEQPAINKSGTKKNENINRCIPFQEGPSALHKIGTLDITFKSADSTTTNKAHVCFRGQQQDIVEMPFRDFLEKYGPLFMYAPQIMANATSWLQRQLAERNKKGANPQAGAVAAGKAAPHPLVVEGAKKLAEVLRAQNNNQSNDETIERVKQFVTACQNIIHTGNTNVNVEGMIKLQLVIACTNNRALHAIVQHERFSLLEPRQQHSLLSHALAKTKTGLSMEQITAIMSEGGQNNASATVGAVARVGAMAAAQAVNSGPSSSGGTMAMGMHQQQQQAVHQLQAAAAAQHLQTGSSAGGMGIGLQQRGGGYNQHSHNQSSGYHNSGKQHHLHDKAKGPYSGKGKVPYNYSSKMAGYNDPFYHAAAHDKDNSRGGGGRYHGHGHGGGKKGAYGSSSHLRPVQSVGSHSHLTHHSSSSPGTGGGTSGGVVPPAPAQPMSATALLGVMPGPPSPEPKATEPKPAPVEENKPPVQLGQDDDEL